MKTGSFFSRLTGNLGLGSIKVLGSTGVLGIGIICGSEIPNTAISEKICSGVVIANVTLFCFFGTRDDLNMIFKSFSVIQSDVIMKVTQLLAIFRTSQTLFPFSIGTRTLSPFVNERVVALLQVFRIWNNGI